MDRAALAALMAELACRYRVPGAQLALRSGGRTVVVTHGELVAGSGIGVDEESAFPLGSLTKPFTAALAMMLVTAGDAELDPPLARYLPELSGTAAELVSLRQLLSHRSGLASGIDEPAVRTTDRRRWVMQNCREADLVHPPGAVFSYSNVGYLLAGLLAELTTGMGWREAVGDILLRPMGITPAFAAGPGPAARPVASGHADGGGTHRATPLRRQSLSEVEAPSGALAASATDLCSFAVACLADADLARLMLTDQLSGTAVGSFGMADGWGLGWAVYRTPGRTWYGHDGNGDGTSCHLRFEPQTATVVALTTNAGAGAAMWEELVARLRLAGLDIGHCPFSSLPGIPEAQPPPGCAGRYRNGPSEAVIAMRDDGALEFSADDLLSATLTCYPGLRFTMGNSANNGTGYVGRFIRNPLTGAIDLAQVAGRTARRIS